MLSITSRIAGERGEQLVELPERLLHGFLRAGAGGVERFLRRVDLAHHERRLAVVLFAGLTERAQVLKKPVLAENNSSGIAVMMVGDFARAWNT